MKALILHQPYATLVALGVKQWETRGAPPNGSMRPAGVRGMPGLGMPGLGIEPGERIAIAAAVMKPADGTEVGEWAVESWRDEPAERCLVHADDRSGRRRVYLLPLGRVVCTAVVAEALPIVAETGEHDDEIYLTTNGFLYRQTVTGDPWVASNVQQTDISDQLPYGDWRPGRWAWRLTDVQPVNGAVEVVSGNRQGVFDAAVTWLPNTSYCVDEWVEVRAPRAVPEPATERVPWWEAVGRRVLDQDGERVTIEHVQCGDGAGPSVTAYNASKRRDNSLLRVPCPVRGDGTVEVLKDGGQ